MQMGSGSTRDRGVASSSLTCVTALSNHIVHIGVTPHPLKHHKHIEFLSNTGPDSLKSIKLLGHRRDRYACETQMMARLYSYFDPSKNTHKKVEPPQTKLSGSAHARG